MTKIRILFLISSENSRIFKQVYGIKRYAADKFHITILSCAPISNKLSQLADHTLFCELKTPYGDSYYIRNYKKIKQAYDKKFLLKMSNILRSSVKKVRPDLIHLHVPPNSPFDLLLNNGDYKYLYDPYDPYYFYGRAKIQLKRELEAEKFLIENAAGIVTKFNNNLIKAYSEEGFDVMSKPFLHFPDYCIDPWIRPIDRNAKETAKITLAYGGATSSSSAIKYFYGNNIYAESFRTLLSEDMNILFFFDVMKPKLLNWVFNTQYENLKNKYENFEMIPKMDTKDFIKKLQSAHFGLQIHDFSKTGHNKVFGETSFGNKFFSYLEAGLPIIVSDNLKLNSEYVEDFKVGFSVGIKNLKDIPEIIRSTDYVTYLNNVEINRSSILNMKNRIHELSNFYEQTI